MSELLSPATLGAVDLKEVDAFCFDCDGVVYQGETAVEGAASLMGRLGQAGRPVFFVTNNSTKSRAMVASKLASMGIPCRPEQVLNSAYSAAIWAQREGLKRVYVMGEEGISVEMRLAGLELVPDTDDERNVDVVAVGLDRGLTYARLCRALGHLQRGARFLATNTDAQYPAENGLLLPGAGVVVSALTTAFGRGPEVVAGKPSQLFVDMVKLAVGTSPERVLMVGDRLETDIAFGRTAGFRTLLVTETGVHNLDDARRQSSDPLLRPHHHAPSIAHIEPLI